MLRIFILFCCCLAIGGFLYQLASEDAGYVLIVWGQKSLETSLWFAILLLLVIGMIGWLSWLFVSGSLRAGVATKRKILGYGHRKAQAKTAEGLIDYIEENWLLAKRKLTRSANNVPTPVINYLAAARSAYELGEEQTALELLHKAETSNDKSGLAVSITQARMQISNKQYEQALASLERASTIKPEHPVVLSMRQQVYVELKDWVALEELLPQLKKYAIGTEEERIELQKHLYQQRLQETIHKNSTQSEQKKLTELNNLWRTIPKKLKNEEAIVSLYTSQLMAMGEHNQAEKVLASALSQQWQGSWLDLYGLLLCDNASLPLNKAEKWLNEQPNSPNLLLALGRLCTQNQQWGRAVDYFEKSARLLPRIETYAELARTLDFMGEKEKSESYYKQGLINASSVLVSDDVYK